MYQKLFSVLFGFTFFGRISNAQNTNNINYTTLRPEWSYCYEFTWFGPEYNNVTGYNGTCTDYLEENNINGKVPCIPPVVISNNSHFPDMDYLWDNHRASILCRRSENQACVKHTYFYNGAVNNQSHMCAKVQLEGKGPLTSGCYTQKVGGYNVELCVCTNGPGIYRPCNGALGGFVSNFLVVFLRFFASFYVLRNM